MVVAVAVAAIVKATAADAAAEVVEGAEHEKHIWPFIHADNIWRKPW